ncbi:hypothetical protein P3T76_007871 [Phytophthora citrophthora]|uniref:Uncharacterized protein n=1 Tax=Phytophthora citrophthora TaxID=4793 RepID=A0AAD9GL25_9STRA|nr:hypothetical protein P3T76_007871 [Phytophthora citrophthora]
MQRFDKYGRNPRFVFTVTQSENDALLNRAITNFDALKVVSYTECSTPVRDEDLSSCVLQMMPSDSNFPANYHLDFLSNDIAEKIVLRVSDENLEKVAKFAIGLTPDDIKFQSNLGFKHFLESENQRL